MSITSTERDYWGALRQAPPEVAGLVLKIASADHVDEHGSWEFGIVSDRRGRWSALNWDCYGVSTDIHSGSLIAVVQVRQSEQTKYGVTVRKSYFLVGTNEDETAFAHPVNANVVHLAVKAEVDVPRACQDWIFGGDYSRMIRQGDLALIPVQRTSGTRDSRRTAVLEASHRLKASSIKRADGGRLYVKNPSLTHLPGTHPSVEAQGWYRLIVGKRARFWSFAAPTVD